MTTTSWLLLALLAYLICGAVIFIHEMTRPNRPNDPGYNVLAFCAIMLIGPLVGTVAFTLSIPRRIGWVVGRIARECKDGYKEGLYS